MGSPDPRVTAVAECVAVIGDEHFVTWPGGWPDEISTALLDAVYSAQQVYRSEKPGVGVYNRVQEFREKHREVRDGLQLLVDMEESEIRRIMDNNVVSDGKQTRKSVAIQHVARRMLSPEVGVRRAVDLAGADSEAVKTAYTGVKGLGWITYEYFLMLLGEPGIKADVMITRFVNAALAKHGLRRVQSKEARRIVEDVHSQPGIARGLSLTDFDHTLWRWQRGR